MRTIHICLVFLFVRSLDAELFSSIEGLADLSHNEGKLIKEYRRLIASLERITEHARRDLKKMELENKKMREDNLEYVSNPINALLLIKRLSFDAVQVRNMIDGLSVSFNEQIESITLPRNDWEGAVDGLVRLQAFYSLESADIAKGIIQGQKYREDLTVSDLFAIGHELSEMTSYQASLSYLNLALDKNRENPEMPELSILHWIYTNHNATENIEEQIKTVDRMIELDPERKDLRIMKKALEVDSLVEREPVPMDEEATRVRVGAITEFRLVSSVCTGRLTPNARKTSKLHCRLVAYSAFSKLAPFKLEEANLNPFIAIYHDVISNDEIEVFKTMSKPSLIRAEVLNKDATSKKDKVRVAQLSWNFDSYHPVFRRLTRRVGEMSGLNMATAEEWQTQNYGIGGHYEAHFDFTEKDAAPLMGGTGNRIATALFYLSDVERGGATVFPYLKIRVQPKKGSALFWFNLSTSGELEYFTRHSACPVLVGNKWVANKWIREHGQEWTRPCELEPAMTDELYYKNYKNDN